MCFSLLILIVMLPGFFSTGSLTRPTPRTRILSLRLMKRSRAECWGLHPLTQIGFHQFLPDSQSPGRWGCGREEGAFAACWLSPEVGRVRATAWRATLVNVNLSVNSF